MAKLERINERKVKRCEKCGDFWAWLPTKSGKWYQANVFFEGEQQKPGRKEGVYEYIYSVSPLPHAKFCEQNKKHHEDWLVELERVVTLQQEKLQTAIDNNADSLKLGFLQLDLETAKHALKQAIIAHNERANKTTKFGA